MTLTANGVTTGMSLSKKLYEVWSDIELVHKLTLCFSLCLWLIFFLETVAKFC